MKRTILAVPSDTHGNHRRGLCLSTVELDDETEEGALIPYRPQLLASQEFLEKCYLDDVRNVIRIARNDDIIVVHGGDPTVGTKYKREMMSTKLADQVEIATANFEVWAQIPNVRAIKLVKGTGVHEFDEGSASTMIAKRLKAEYPHLDVNTAYHYILNIDNYLVDISHHGPGPGIRAHTRGNVVEWYTKSMMMDMIMGGKRVPDLVLRSHRHRYVPRPGIVIRTFGRSYKCDAYLLPSYCMTDEYAKKVAQSPWYLTIGLLAFEIIDGELRKVHEFLRDIDIRTKEIVKYGNS